MPRKGRKPVGAETPQPDPEFQGAFQRLLGACTSGALNLLNKQCTCVFYQDMKVIGKEVKNLMDIMNKTKGRRGRTPL